MCDIIYIYPRLPGRKKGLFGNMIPYGLSSITAYLEKENYSGKIFDLQVQIIELKKEIKKENPFMVCISGTTESRFESFRIAKLIKEIDNNIVIIYGGPHASFTALDTLKHVSGIDIIVVGEGEETVLKLAKLFRYGDDELGNIKGIYYRKNGEITKTLLRPRITNLDLLPLPARNLLPMEKYNLKMDFLGIKGDVILTSRGCPFGCLFCSASALWGKGYITRSAGSVIKEIKFIMKNYNVKGVKLFDSTFTLQRSHVTYICEEIHKEGLNIPWECEVHAGTVDKELLSIMKNAGCYYIDLGLESASERVLSSTGKKITLKQVEQVINWANGLDIYVKLFLTWGYPSETVADAQKTLEFMKKFSGKAFMAGPSPLIIYPGTPLERYAIEIGYLPKDFSWCKPYFDVGNKDFGISPFVPVFLTKELNANTLRKMSVQHFLSDKPSIKEVIAKLIKVRPRKLWNITKALLKL